MANVTRIKASDSGKAEPAKEKPAKDKPTTDAPAKTAIVAPADNKAKQNKKPAKSTDKKVFILFRPFVAFFRYLRESWREIRQVRWPNRKATWKMVLAVLVYTAIFVILISLLDLLFTWLFNLILGSK
ncbi:preprotein translocase subunit SecE [Candidatus Saccharibacteria bacterium]|nr:preprotein translocase subunit SecE [Candidatus Saccharibacteria bacterium]